MTRSLVVGGGISGLATALVLSRQNVDVELVEREAAIEALGHGITLIGPALRALDRLGLFEECLASGFGIHELQLFDVAGTELDRYRMPSPVGTDQPGMLGILRPELHRILTGHAMRAGITIRTGQSPVVIEHDGGSASVTFTSGERERYDLVVGADGLRSTVRGLVFGEMQPNATGQEIFRVLLERPPELRRMTQFLGERTTVVGLSPQNDDTMYMYCLRPVEPTYRPPKDQWPSIVRELLAPYGGVVESIRDTIIDPARINYTVFEYLVVPQPWYRGRTVLVGDSAHCTTPHLAAGGAMCLEDALALGEELDAAGSIEHGLAAYSRRRFDRCKFVVETSALLSTWQVHPGTPDADHEGTMAKAFQRLAEPF